jgi:dethiobiotin synthase
VAGTDTGVGKTVVSALLLRAARRTSRAAYWKPVQTGSDSDTATVGRLADALPHELLRPAYELALPASPHEAATSAGAALEPQRIAGAFDGLRRLLDDTALVVELAGGLLVPYRLGYTQLDWLAREAAPLVLVARSGLGTLNHTLLSLESLRARHLEPRALFVVGEPHPSNRETLRAMGGVASLFEVPLFEPLDTSALDAWLSTHDLEHLFGA